MNRRKESVGADSAAEQMRSELKRIRYKRTYMRTLRSTLFSLIFAAALILVIAAYLPVVRITGDSMANTLNRGDILLAMRSDEVQRGDLIVFYVEGNKMLVKRVIACAGDKVQIEQDGTVSVNDQPLVVTQSLQPVLNVCCIVAEAARRFKTAVTDESRSAEFCDQFFFAVCIRTEECCFAQAIQAACMSCTVREFMECSAVIFSCAFKLGV